MMIVRAILNCVDIDDVVSKSCFIQVMADALQKDGEVITSISVAHQHKHCERLNPYLLQSSEFERRG